MSLGSPPDWSASGVVNEDIKLPPRIAVSGKGRIVSTEGIREAVFKLTPIEEHSTEEGEVCESVVDTTEVIPVMLANQANKVIIKEEKG